MTQDTRKDRRVKIVSLNVRYKSATVDEFIENHAHDVSRGGIYIKTGSPFPPGTLLKFEIRLVSDQALIMGVGRVVWKRDTTQGTGDRPAGMGVKFIKIDEPSKSVIDKLMNTRSDAGRAYESEVEVTASASEAAAPAPRTGPSRLGKSTMLGVASLPQPGAGSASSRPPGTPSSPPRPAATIAMFPKAGPEPESTEPKQEQTVMKQAAELLEEALREAGGSMEDVGTNPLFAGVSAAAKNPASPASDPLPAAPRSIAPDGTSVPLSDAPAAIKAKAMVAGMAPAPATTKVTSDPPRTTRESPAAKSLSPGEARPTSRPPGRPSLSSSPQRAPKKGASGTLMFLGVVAAAAIAGVTFRDKLFGGGATADPPVAASAAQGLPPEPAPSASSLPSPDLAASGSAMAPAASEAPTASASAAPSASAAAPASAAAASPTDSAPASPRTPSVVAHPAWTRPTQPQTAPVGASKPPAAAAPSAAPSEPAAAPAAPAATSVATAPATAAAPAPSAKPKAKPADDNPY